MFKTADMIDVSKFSVWKWTALYLQDLYCTNGDYARGQHKAFRVFMKSSWSRVSEDQGS